MLKEKTLFGEIDKEQIVIDRLLQFEPVEGYYLATSFGKDSIVLMDLAKRSGVKYDPHMSLTTVDPPELIRFAKEHYPDVPRERAPQTMWSLIIERRMPPTRLVRYCCAVLKERGGAGRVVLTGIRRDESVKRAGRNMVETCFKDKTKTYVNPIIDWTSNDVWDYIHKHNLPYCELYDQGFHRIGCIGCPMARKEQLMGFERYPRFKALYIKTFQKMVDKRLRDGLATTWDTGQDVFDWWVANRERRKKDHPDQTVMFE